MGLLSKISSKEPQKNINGEGLLEKATLLSSFRDFSYFCRSNNFSHCCLFTSVDGMYVASHSCGMTASSLIKSISSRDFWVPVFTSENTWFSFSTSSSAFGPFFQFFDSQDADRLTQIHLAKISADAFSGILMVAAYEDEETGPIADISQQFLTELLFCITNSKINSENYVQSSIKHGITICPANMYIISFKNCISQYLAKYEISTEKLQKHIRTAIAEELAAEMNSAFSLPNICLQSSEEEFKVLLFSPEETDEQLLRFHLIHSYEKFFDRDTISLLQLFPAGVSRAQKTLSAFLTQA